MKYYIAIDAGGNKTDSVLFDQTGTVIARELTRGANAFDIGPAEVGTRLSSIVELLKASLPTGEKLTAIFGGISAAHFYPEIAKHLTRCAGGAKVVLDNLISSTMAEKLGKDDGVSLISGTGSYCCVRKDGKRFFIGSSGYMLDTGGSGYVLGQQALIAAQRELDGRGEKTLLTKLLEKEMGESVLEHLPVIYSGGRAYISYFAHIVFEARAMGDALATKIFDDNVAYFAEAMQAAYRYMGKPYQAVLGGGIFLHHPEYVAAVRAKAPEGCELTLMDAPAVYGAALEALWANGDEAPKSFKEQFMDTYSRHPVKNTSW